MLLQVRRSSEILLKLTTVALPIICVITTIAPGLLKLAQTVVGWCWR